MTTVKIIAIFQNTLDEFRRFTAGTSLKELFVASTGINSVHIKAVQGMWDASALAVAATQQGEALLASFVGED